MENGSSRAAIAAARPGKPYGRSLQTTGVAITGSIAVGPGFSDA